MADGKPTEVFIDSGPKIVRTWEEARRHIDFNNRQSWPDLGRGVSVEHCLKTTWDNQEPVVYKQFKSGGDGAWGLSNAKESVENLGDLQGGILPKTYALLEEQKAVVQEYVEPRAGFRDQLAVFNGFSNADRLKDNPEQYQSASTAAEWLKGYFSGLRELHRKGYIYFDMKPDDVMLAEDGRVVFIDLGNMRREGDIRAQHVRFAADISMFGDLFFSLTEAAKKNGKGLTPEPGGKYNRGPSSNRDMSEPIKMAKADLAPASMIRVLESIDAVLGKSNNDFRAQNLEENLQVALDNYFQELGIGNQPEQVVAQPVQPVNIEAGNPPQRQEGLLPQDKDLLDKYLDFYRANDPKFFRDPRSGWQIIETVSKSLNFDQDLPQEATAKKAYLNEVIKLRFRIFYSGNYPGLEQETQSINNELVKDKTFQTEQWQKYEDSLPPDLKEFNLKNQQQLFQNPEYGRLMWEVIQDQIVKARLYTFERFGHQRIQAEPFASQIQAKIDGNLNAIGKIRTQLGYARSH